MNSLLTYELLEPEGLGADVDILVWAPLDTLAFHLLVLGLLLVIELQLGHELPGRRFELGVLARVWFLEEARGIWRVGH